MIKQKLYELGAEIVRNLLNGNYTIVKSDNLSVSISIEDINFHFWHGGTPNKELKLLDRVHRETVDYVETDGYLEKIWSVMHPKINGWKEAEKQKKIEEAKKLLNEQN